MILNEFFNLPQVFEKDMEEGMFGSRPSPVLPIVAKIDRVARELNPQNVETGKQIIQSHTRDITRMLSPQSKAGVDVIEQDMAEGDFTISDDPSANAKLLFLKTINGNEYRLVKQGNDVYKIYVNRSTKNKQVFPSFDLAKKALQQLLLNAVHTHEQGVAEGKDDYVPPKEADYGDKYQAMVRRVGQKAKAQEKAKQQQPKAPVRESRLALLKQIIQS